MKKVKDLGIESIIKAVRKSDGLVRYFSISSIYKLDFFILDLKDYSLLAFEISEDILERDINGTELKIIPIGFNSSQEDNYIIYEQEI